MIRYFIVTLTCMSINGCGLKKEAPMNIYSLQAVKIMPIASTKQSNRTIKIAFPQTLKEKISNKINYSYSMHDQGVYLHSQWSNNSGKLIQGSVIQALDSSKLFKAVLPYESTVGEDLRLESNIYDFSHHVRGEASYAVVSILFTLIDTDNGKIIRAKRFSYREDTQTIDAKGYVNATQKAIDRLCKDLVNWLK